MDHYHGTISDEKIVSLFWERNEDAIRITGSTYEPYLYTIAFNILGDEESSKECVNDALFYFWTHIPPDRPKWFRGYIARITRSIACDRFKEKNRQKRVPPAAVLPLDDLVDYLQDGSDVEKEIETKLLADCLEKYLESLNRSQRVIFIGKYYCSYTTARIAGLLRMNERQVFRELTKMKKRLKEVLQKEGFIDVYRPYE